MASSCGLRRALIPPNKVDLGRKAGPALSHGNQGACMCALHSTRAASTDGSLPCVIRLTQRNKRRVT